MAVARSSDGASLGKSNCASCTLKHGNTIERCVGTFEKGSEAIQQEICMYC